MPRQISTTFAPVTNYRCVAVIIADELAHIGPSAYHLNMARTDMNEWVSWLSNVLHRRKVALYRLHLRVVFGDLWLSSNRDSEAGFPAYSIGRMSTTKCYAARTIYEPSVEDSLNEYTGNEMCAKPRISSVSVCLLKRD